MKAAIEWHLPVHVTHLIFTLLSHLCKSSGALTRAELTHQSQGLGSTKHGAPWLFDGTFT